MTTEVVMISFTQQEEEEPVGEDPYIETLSRRRGAFVQVAEAHPLVRAHSGIVSPPFPPPLSLFLVGDRILERLLDLKEPKLEVVVAQQARRGARSPPLEDGDVPEPGRDDEDFLVVREGVAAVEPPVE